MPVVDLVDPTRVNMESTGTTSALLHRAISSSGLWILSTDFHCDRLDRLDIGGIDSGIEILAGDGKLRIFACPDVNFVFLGGDNLCNSKRCWNQSY